MPDAGTTGRRSATEEATARGRVELRARVDHGDFALDVDLQLPAHGVTAVFGPSGCGKTTLLRAAAGLTRPRPGRIAVAGEIWQDDARDLWLPTHRRPLGMVFQDAALFDHLTVQGNLDFGRRRVAAGQRRVALARAIELLGIGHLLQRRPAQLSGGERQRVGIARALATSPRLLLMDEPMASLDAARKIELLPYFERVVRELDVPMLYVTHALDEVAHLADHLVLLENGRVRAHGRADDLLADLDLARSQGDHAGAIIEGRMAALARDDHLMTVRFSGGALLCVQRPADAARIAGQPVRLRVLARDVSVTLSAARDTSVLNILPATIEELAPDGPAQVLLALRIGDARLLARITRRSARALGLTVRQSVFAQIKGVAVLD